MVEEKKTITIDDVEYTEDQLSDAAKICMCLLYTSAAAT